MDIYEYNGADISSEHYGRDHVRGSETRSIELLHGMQMSTVSREEVNIIRYPLVRKASALAPQQH